MSGLNPRDYHKLDVPLQDITSSRISLNLDDVKKYNEQLTKLLQSTLIPEMEKADPLFKCLFKRLLYSGSYYENLKISKPNEFDLNLELEIPSKNIEIVSTLHTGFVRVKVKQFDEVKLKRCFRDYEMGVKRLQCWLDDDCFLKREHVLNWMQGVVDKALREVKIPNTSIYRSRSGPAVTLNVTSFQRKQMEYSIDLVPVFIFGADHWPKHPVRQPGVRTNVSWCVVPKAPGYVPQHTHWRMSFYDQEKKIMMDLNSMKHIIKLMKLLRDQQKWDWLSSYYIKTMFLWEMEAQNRSFWNQSIGFLFIHMLKRFVYHLKDLKAIPFFWDKRHNLIRGMNSVTIENTGNSMNMIIKNIERNLANNPQYVKNYFSGETNIRTPTTQPLPQPLLAEHHQPRQQPMQVQSEGWGILAAGAAVGIIGLAASFLINQSRRNNS